MSAAIWGVLAGLGAVILGAFGLASRASGANAEKAKEARAAAVVQDKMAQAAAEAPRTRTETQDRLRGGSA